MQRLLFDFKMKKLIVLNKDREYFHYKSGDLIYILFPLQANLGRLPENICKVYWTCDNLKMIPAQIIPLCTLDGI